MKATVLFSCKTPAEGVDDPSFDIGMREVFISLESFIISAIFAALVLILFKLSYRQEIPKSKTTLQTPTRRSISDPAEYWQSSLLTHVDLTNMQSYCEKPMRRRKDMSSYDFFIFVLKKMAAPKRLRPVQLLSSSLQYHVKRTWMIIAWVVSTIIIVVSAYLVMLYSLKYGEVQSLKWLSSLTMTMGQDIFVFTPIKIIILAVILSMAFERIFDAGYFQLKVKDAMRLELYGNREYLNELVARRTHKMYYPMSDQEKLVTMLRSFIVVDILGKRNLVLNFLGIPTGCCVFSTFLYNHPISILEKLKTNPCRDIDKTPKRGALNHLFRNLHGRVILIYYSEYHDEPPSVGFPLIDFPAGMIR
ncbi:polycystic kidney disease protein 1-like [Homalodisca vitripennis]|nr:polycystic kidney disease protein 1-like [Homalodisca vitripennis]